MLGGTLFVLVLAAAGAALGRALAGGRLGRAEAWALGTGTALGALTLLAYLAGAVGLGLPGPLAQLALLAALGLGARTLGRAQAARVARDADAGDAPTASPPGRGASSPGSAAAAPDADHARAARSLGARLAGLALLASLALALAMAGDWGRAEPGGAWDGMANWTTQARHLARTDGDPGAGLRARVIGHPEYPLLVPLGVALGWQWTGDETQHVPRLLGVLLLLVLAAGAAGALQRVAGPVAGRLAAAALLAAPGLQLAARAHTADVPLAAFALLAGTRLVESLDALREGRAPSTPHALTGLLLGLLPWVKNEGLLLAACLVLAALPALLAHARGAPALLGRLALGALPALAAWRAFKALHAPPDRFFVQLRPALRRFLPDPERWRTALHGVREELLPVDLTAPALHDPWLARWGGLAALALAALLLGALRRPRTALGVPLLASLGWLAVLVLIYVLTLADDPRWHVETSLWRLLLQMLPFTLFGALAAWSRPAAAGNPPGAAGMLRDSTPERDRT